MTRRAIRIPVAGEVTQVELQAEAQIKQWIGGGWLEVLRVGDHLLWMDEEGSLTDMPFNPRASYLAQRRIAGHVVLTGVADEEGEITDIGFTARWLLEALQPFAPKPSDTP